MLRPRSWSKRSGLIAALAAILFASNAAVVAQDEGGDIFLGSCLPPEDPYPFDPPDDPELRAMINEEYQDFLRDAEDYLNCLQAETRRAIEKTNIVLTRYVELFGDDAALQSTE